MRWLESIPKRSGISVFLPSTLLATEETIMLKTIKFGIFLRYLAIFKVDTVVVYLDDNDSKDYPLISALDVNKIHFGDKYTGNYEELLLKPKKYISTKTLKRGIVINNPKNENKIILFIDPENIFEFEGDKGNILDYFEIFESEFPLLVKYKSEKFSSFDFKISDKNLIEIVEEYRKSFIIIGTSEFGVPYYSLISETIFSKPISLVFGPSKDGIEGTLSRVVKTNKAANNHIQPNKSLIKSMFDFYINTIPNQGTETVRLEEAVGSTLSLFNNEIEKKRKIEEERKKE